MQVKYILALMQSIPGTEQSYSSLLLLVFTLSAALLGEILWVGICDWENFIKMLSYDKSHVAKGTQKINYQPALVT